MGVQILSPESHQSKPLRSLPKIPKSSKYSTKPLNMIKPSRVLPTVPSSNLSKTEQQNTKVARSLPRVSENSLISKHVRMLPEVPFKEINNPYLKDNNTSGSSRNSTPRQNLNNSISTQHSNQHGHVHHQHTTNGQPRHGYSQASQQYKETHIVGTHNAGNHNVTNHNAGNHNVASQNAGTHNVANHNAGTHNVASHNAGTHKVVNHNAGTHNVANHNAGTHNVVTESATTHSVSQHGNAQRALPKIPKVLQKPKPELNRIEYMHEVYRKEGDLLSEDGNYEQALKSYNLALKFISDEKTTIIARARVYRKLGKLRKAMQDADLALKLDPLFYEGLLQKAELLLEQGEYENALNFFQKGARMRPDKDDFQEGIEKAKHGLAEYNKGARKRKNVISPEDGSQQKKSKDKAEKAHKNRDNANVQVQRERTFSNRTDDTQNYSYGSHGSSHQEPMVEDALPDDAPLIVPIPPAQPPPVISRAKLGRQTTPMPGPLKTLIKDLKQSAENRPRNPSAHNETKNPHVASSSVDDVNEDLMKQILGSMYKDRDYLEKFLGESEHISLPGTTNVGSTAQNGLNFLYDRVLNWVRKGETVPNIQPTPLPRETKTSAQRKSMAHGSSVESLLEEHDKENETRLSKRKKTQSKAPQTWYSYLENKKLEEANERKQARNSFLDIVEGHKIKPEDQARQLKLGAQNSKRKEGTLHKGREHGSKESLNQSFIFTSYRPGSDLRNSKTSKGAFMETSDPEDQQVQIKTPPKKLKQYGAQKERLERRRLAVAKFVTKEIEEVEFLYADNKYNECAEKASHLLRILESEDWPEKYPFIATIHSYLGNVFISKKDFENGLMHHNKDLEIGEKHVIDEAVSRALGNLGRVYVVQKRHQEALDVFLRKTPMCASRIETAWLFHEIGNCFLALGDFEYAKDAAKKSLEAAEEAVEWSYQLQSCVLMGVAEVKLKQYHAAFNTFEKALDQAKLQGDEKAEDAIREALQDVNERVAEEMRTKGPMNFQLESRSDAFMTPLSRSNTGLTEYQMQGLSRSRAEIAKMQADVGYRCRADYAKTPAAFSEYSSILIPEDDGNASLTDTVGDVNDINIDLERLRTQSTLFGSSLDLRGRIRSAAHVSGNGN